MKVKIVSNDDSIILFMHGCFICLINKKLHLYGKSIEKQII